MTANGSIFASYPGARNYWVAGSGGFPGFILCQVKWHIRRIYWHHAKKIEPKRREKSELHRENDVRPDYGSCASSLIQGKD
jgi:hypothetical protein